MIKFSLPYIDQPIEFWNELYKRYRYHIWEVYFPISSRILPTGRPVQPEQHMANFLKNFELPKTVLLNPIILSKPIEQIADLILNELYILNKYYGIQKAIVTNLQLCKLIRQELPFYRLTASVLMGIQSVEQIVYINDAVDELTPDTSVLRNIKRLTEIRNSFKKIIKLIVNEGCLPYCPLRTQHFYEMSTDNSYPASLCNSILQKTPWLRLKTSWVLPQHLKFYEGLYDVIKLAGRVTLQNPLKFLKVLDSYLKQIPLHPNEIGCGPAGIANSMEIDEKFYWKTLTCNKNCNYCSICKDYYEKYAQAFSGSISSR